MKVFCIGFNKTGTTTIEKVLKDLGYKMPRQGIQEQILTKKVIDGDFSILKSFCEKYEAFQDMPFSQGQTYVNIDTLFPKSKFILTVRDSDKWFDSLFNSHSNLYARRGLNINDISEADLRDKYIYLNVGYFHEIYKNIVCDVRNNEAMYRWDDIYNKDYNVQEYELRNRQIIKYFHRRHEQLLVIDVSKEETTKRIVDFLGLSADLVANMPHLNKRALQA